MKDKKIVYVDGIDWQHEMGETNVEVWPSKLSILDRTLCAKTCGVVRCEIKLLEWVHPSHAEEEKEMTDEEYTKKIIPLLQKKIESHQERIKALQERIAKKESCI
jgi:hypothetical protein